MEPNYNSCRTSADCGACVRQWLVFVVAAILLAGCGKGKHSSGVVMSPPGSPSTVHLADQLRALILSDPIGDAVHAYSLGDFRLVGVSGVSLYVPGIEWKGIYINNLGIKVVDGTSDSISDISGKSVNDAALSYATKYNAELLILLTKGRKPK